jgi:DNA-binding NtrC family response regulator
VSVVSNNGETLDGLARYFEGAGVQARSTRAIDDLTLCAPEKAAAVVLFPDDFAEASVLAFLRALRGARPGMLVLVITRHASRYRALFEAGEGSTLSVVLPRPCFGWDILDAIRAHAQRTDFQ